MNVKLGLFITLRTGYASEYDYPPCWAEHLSGKKMLFVKRQKGEGEGKLSSAVRRQCRQPRRA